MNSMDNYLLEIPLEQDARSLALQFASEQANPPKGKRVYFNTLAVWAVNYFLEWMELETDINGGDSWHPGIRAVFDVADLVLPGIGKIECCPVKVGEQAISLPLEVRENRIAYVAVEFAEPFYKVKLLGFIPAVGIGDDTEQIPLSEFKPIEELLDYLYRIESGILELESAIKELLSSPTEDDLVEAKVQEILARLSTAEIVAKLEGVYRSHEESNWGYEGGKALAEVGSGGGILGGRNSDFSMNKSPGTSSNVDEDVAIELNLIAEDLLEKLAEIWGDGDE